MNKFCLFFISVMLLLAFGCNSKKGKQQVAETIETEVADSTVYGICGEGTSMNSLELVTDAGDTIVYSIAPDDGIDEYVNGTGSKVEGGLMAGDKVAVVGHKIDGELVADKVINVTSLLGHWISIDKNFEIEEGGVVRSEVKAETNPWTAWKILNGQLLLNRDTFEINSLGADSLYIENSNGIFTFKRQK